MRLDVDLLVNRAVGLVDQKRGVSEVGEVAVDVVKIAAAHPQLIGDFPNVLDVHQAKVGLKGP